MTALRFVSMPTIAARAFQAGAPDANGQPPERHVATEDGLPCRHCQQPISAGEPYLILAYRPFPAAQPYAELGPIFLHAEPCERHPDSATLPPSRPANARRRLSDRSLTCVTPTRSRP